MSNGQGKHDCQEVTKIDSKGNVHVARTLGPVGRDLQNSRGSARS